MSRVFNFNPGPSTLPLQILEKTRDEMTNYLNTGMSILESSHREKAYQQIHEEALANLRQLLLIPDEYKILLLQGGASLQFAMVPMNFLHKGRTADYINSGAWALKAIHSAQCVGNIHIAANTHHDIPKRIPSSINLDLTANAPYLHITSNETISGVQWKLFPERHSCLIADMSSDILSRPIDISQFGLIYAGAQKNLGIAGVTVVIIRRDLSTLIPDGLPEMLNYNSHITTNSMLNTPPCFSIYCLLQVTRWIQKIGIDTVYARNINKATRIYEVIDKSSFYRGIAAKGCRSNMNITFRLPNEKLGKKFESDAQTRKLIGLKGHRSVGGLRASIYNAFPLEGIDALVSFMSDFENDYG